MPETETAEEISKKPEVRKELERTGEKEPAKKVKAATTDKFWFVTHGLLLVGCAVLYYLIGTKLLPLIQSEVDLGRRFLRGFALVVIVLATAKAVRVYAIGRIEDTVTRFTLRRILLLVAGLLIAVIVISVVFVNWYGALTALGIGSIIVGLAVQTPMKASSPGFTFWCADLSESAIELKSATPPVTSSTSDISTPRSGNLAVSTFPETIRAAVLSDSRTKKCSMKLFGIIPGHFSPTSGMKLNFKSRIRAI